MDRRPVLRWHPSAVRRVRIGTALAGSLIAVALVAASCLSPTRSVPQEGPSAPLTVQRALPSDASSPSLPAESSAAVARPTLPATGVSPSPATSVTALAETVSEPFDYGTFHDSTTVDNAWFPLVPGTRWTFEGKTNDGRARVARKVVITVTDLVKVIDGVPSRVTYDLDYTSGELEERELAFYAQDDAGFVWLMGEYPEEVEDGKTVKAPAWIAGRQDAMAGIMMRSEPEPYAPSYSEGWGPAVGWTDRAKVFETDSATCVRAGCYSNVLVIDEFNRDEPDAHQLKYYARGVGGVRVGWAGAKEEEQEVLELVSLERLSPDAMAKVDAAALAQDIRAGTTRPDVFDQVPPAQAVGR